MKYRNILVSLLACLLVTLVSCSSSPEVNDQEPVTLVVFYSDGQDGISETAKMAAKAGKCHFFEIQPEKDFSSLLEKLRNGTELTAAELEDLYSMNFKLTTPVPPNWDAYDRILLGCPVWLGGAATPVRLFLEQNDLTDKTFFPFTIGTEEEGKTTTDQLSLDGWREGFEETKVFEESPKQDAVSDWVTSLSSRADDSMQAGT